MQEARLSSLLIVDDSALDSEVVSIACASLGCPIDTVTDPLKALELYKAKKHSLVLIDYMMEPIDGIELVRRFRAYDPEINCLMMTNSPDGRVLEFLHESDLPDLVTKPIKPNYLKEQIRIALGRRFGGTAQPSRVALSMKMDRCLPLQGESLEIVQVRKQITDYLAADTSSLIVQGPRGIGKPEVARFIHDNGKYANSAYHYIDCRDLEAAELARRLISPEGECGTLLQSETTTTIVLGHLEAVPHGIQSALASQLRELCRRYQFIFLLEQSIDDLLAAGQLSDALYLGLTFPIMELPALSSRPVDVEAIVRFIHSHAEDFDYAAGSREDLDYLVGTLRREALGQNIDELFERVVGKPSRRIRGLLELSALPNES